MQGLQYSSRYFRIKGKDGYHRGNMVVPFSSLARVANHLDYREELHISLEYYNQDGTTAGSLLCFDVDFDNNLYKAHATAVRIASQLGSMGIDFKTYFSGNKGFHILIPKLIVGEDAVRKCKEIKKRFLNIVGVDNQLYRHFGTMRCEGSINQKSGMYKIECNLQLPLDRILSKAKEIQKVKPFTELDQTIDISRFESVRIVERSYTSDFEDYNEEDVVPCIKRMWEDMSPPSGNRHNLIYTYAKAMLMLGHSVDAVISMFDSHPFWSNYGGYEPVIKSIASSGRYGIGCKSGVSSDIMKMYCTELCWFNDSLNIRDVLGE